MKKSLLYRIIALVVLNIFVMSFGLSAFAATPTTVQPRWSHLSVCSYLFEMDQSYPEYDVIACGGTTSAGMYDAYVKVQLQRLSNGSWVSVASLQDEGFRSAAVEEYIPVAPGFSYRLYVTHKALDPNTGAVLETFSYESDNYIVSLPRN